MLLKRPLPSLVEKIVLSAVCIIIGCFILTLLSVLLGDIQNSHNKARVHQVVKQILVAGPKDCRSIAVKEYSAGKVFGTGHYAELTFGCNQVTVARAISDIKKFLVDQHYDKLIYSELDKKADYPDVAANFSYSDKDNGALNISYRLQNKSDGSLTAPDRVTLDQLPVEQIYIMVSL